ncbi:MAG: hypothetical protein QOE92_1349, partial [Chloroflexota bacterium]|nr:hypothetical protein [Chloroflexota bacterium]
RRTAAPGPVPPPRTRPVAGPTTVVGARRNILPYALAVAGILIIAVILGVALLPSATVSIITSARVQADTPTITGAVSPPGNAGQTVQTTIQQASQNTSQDRPATGKKDVAAAPSTGQVVFHNSSSGTFGCCTFQVPAGTEVYTDDGKKFLTTQDSNQFGSGKDSQPVGVQARLGGQAGNVPAGSIKHISTSDPQANDFLSVNNPEATANGADASQKTVVSQTDLDQAKNDLGNDLTNKVKDELNQKANGQKLIDETLQISVDPKFDHAAGDEADNFKADITVNGQVTTVAEDKLKGAVLDALKKKVPPGYTLTTDEPKIEYHVVQKDDKGNIIWDASISGFIAAAVDKEDIKKHITGQSPQKAKNYVQQNVDAADVIIKQSPAFMPWMPFLAARIDILQQVDNTAPK